MSCDSGAEKINFYFQHGWGFDRNCWRGLSDAMAAGRAFYADRGYLGNPAAPALAGPEPSCRAVICHSLGLHLLAEPLLQRTELLVVISGFRHFHGQSRKEGLFSRRHVKRMVAELKEEPHALLQKFYRDCDFPFPADAVLDAALLLQDLLFLDTNVLEAEKLRRIPHILLLHGSADRIVPPARGRQLAACLPGAGFVEIEGAGHGLPFTHPGECWRLIAEKLLEIR